MKTHAIIPIFIPHKGCPNDCVFCNQKKITAREDDVTPERVKKIIADYLETIENRDIKTIEVAFFGGSFTGLDIEEQSAFLAEAKKYKDANRIHKIHLSTRPDYINIEILENLKKYDVDIIELGVQSFDSEVLEASGRGHGTAEVYAACDLIKEYGFSLGIQLMIGLPKDTKEKCIKSAKETAKIKPNIARLYPTVVINDTELACMLKRGEYEALTTEKAVDITKEMYKILTSAGINVIRVGLKSTDLINDSKKTSELSAQSGYHPAFRQLVEGEIARETLDIQMCKIIEKHNLQVVQKSNSASDWQGTFSERKVTADTDVLIPKVTADTDALITEVTADTDALIPKVTADKDALIPKVTATTSSAPACTSLHLLCFANAHSFSNVVGHKATNKHYFAEKYPNINISYKVDDTLADGVYKVVKYLDTHIQKNERKSNS